MILQKLEKLLEYGIYLWIFLLPWQVRYFYQAELKGGVWEAGSLSIYLSEIILIFLLFLNFILWVSKSRADKKLLKDIKFSSPLIWLLIFVFWVFISAWWSVLPALSVYYGLKFLLALGIIWLIKLDKISFSRVAVIIVASGLLQGLLAVSQFLNQLVWGSKWLGMAWQDAQNLGVSVVDTGLRRWLRAYGSFPHPNILGGFLTIALVFCFYLYEQTNRLWQQLKNKQLEIFNTIVLFVTMFIFSGLLLSFSRAAWLGVGLFLFIIFVQLIFKKGFFSWTTFNKLFLLIVFTGAIWISVYTEPFLTRINASERLEQFSINQRIDSYQDAWQTFKQKPFLGTGIGVYTYNLHRQHPERYVWDLQPPHNTFLLVLVELGLVGFILFLIIIFLLSKNINFKPQRIWLIIMLVFLMLFDHWWWSLSVGIYLLFLFFGLILYKKE